MKYARLRLLNAALRPRCALRRRRAAAEDIDLFVGAAASVQNERAGDHRQQRQLELGEPALGRRRQRSPFKQGQSELRALRTVAGKLNDKINLGLMLFTPGQGANADGGYVRFHMRQMTPTNKSGLQELIGTATCTDGVNMNGTPNCMFKNFSGAEQAATSDTDYSAALFEVFKYFGGYTSPAHAHDDVAGHVAGGQLDTVAGPGATHFGPVRYAGNPDAKTDSAAFSARCRSIPMLRPACRARPVPRTTSSSSATASPARTCRRQC
jgi:type IV pilus assembly protein PilY1